MHLLQGSRKVCYTHTCQPLSEHEVRFHTISMAGAEAERGVGWERDRDEKQLGEEVGVRAREKVKDLTEPLWMHGGRIYEVNKTGEAWRLS